MKRDIFNFIFALSISTALSLKVSEFINIGYDTFYNFNTLSFSIILIFAFYLLCKTKYFKLKFMTNFICLLLGIFSSIGNVLKDTGTIFTVLDNPVTVICFILHIIGFTAIFRIIFHYIDLFLCKKNIKKKLEVNNKKVLWFVCTFKCHPFIVSLISILLVWLIYIIAFYPIVLSPDPSNQILQFFNIPNEYSDWVIQMNPNVYMTTHHPVFQTFILGYCIEFGRWLINDNFGLFIYTLLQSIIYSSVFAYSVSFAYKSNVRLRYCLLLLLMYLIVPMYELYSVSAVKDVLYTSFIMLFVLKIFDFIRNYKNHKMPVLDIISLSLIMILVSLFRNNGIYVMVTTFLFLFFYSKKNMLRILSSFVIFMVVIYSFNNILIPSLGISKGSVREMLSIPFQQTARYVTYCDDELSDGDKEVIDKLLTYDTLKDRYDPELSDPVKNEYNKNATSEDLKEYFKVWFKGLKKHPLVYIDATLNNIYGYFSLNAHNWYVYINSYELVNDDNVLNYHYNKLSWLRSAIGGYANAYPYFPIIGLLANIGFNTYLLFALFAYLFKYNKKYIIVLIPLICTLGFCVLGPANTYFRYAMPYIFVLPVLSLLLITVVRGEQNEKK